MELKKPTITTVVGVAAVVALAAPITFGAITNQRVEWWSAWGQWVGGVGSTAAAVVALFIAQRSWQQAEKDRHEERVAKARMITVTYVPAPGLQGSVQIENRGTFHVYEVNLIELSIGQQYGPGHWVIGSPLDAERIDLLPQLINRELPSRNVASRQVFYQEPGGQVNGAEAPPDVTIEFTDASGRWRRTGAADPVLISSTP